MFGLVKGMFTSVPAQKRATESLTPGAKGLAIGSYVPARSAPNLTAEEQDVADRFHDMYYSKVDEGRGLHTIVLSWLGYEMFKCPMDLWTYQEIIVQSRPDLIIETGTYKGGSALFLASICDLVGTGEIISIDIDATHRDIRPSHPRIRYIEASSTAPETLRVVKKAVDGRRNVLVILDSDHHRDHVLEELRVFRDFVPVGGNMIVEDTNINGHPTYASFGPGPWEAVEAFLEEDERFVVDRTYERFILTMNPRGFLKRVS